MSGWGMRVYTQNLKIVKEESIMGVLAILIIVGAQALRSLLLLMVIGGNVLRVQAYIHFPMIHRI